MINLINSKKWILCLSILSCGLYAVFLGKDLSWDVANYHYYNPYAWLHHRATQDFWPPSYIQMYFPPLTDLLPYGLLHYFSPLIATFVMGAIHGINAWVLYLIIKSFLPPTQPYRSTLALFLSFLGMYSSFGLAAIGDFKNDLTASIFILAFILWQIKALQFYRQYQQFSKSSMFGAGLLLGIGIGLKLTNGLFLLGGLCSLSLLKLAFKERLYFILYLILASLAGLLISNGYWMVLLWKHYANPFFPFFNALFKSPYYLNDNVNNYTPFLPKGFWQNIFFPFYFGLNHSPAEGDTNFYDIRFTLVAILFLLYTVLYFFRKKRYSEKESLLTSWLFYFFISAYVIWQLNFAVLRYIFPITMLCPLIIYLLVINILKHPKQQLIVLTCTFYSMIFVTMPPTIIRAPWYSKGFFNIALSKKLPTTEPALVLTAYPAYALHISPRPQTYLIPFLPQQWHYVGIPFLDAKHLLFEGKLEKQILQKITAFSGKFYMLASADAIPLFYNQAKKMGLTPAGDCYHIYSDRQKLSNTQTLLCPLSKA